ncbi:MAG: diacylglycerol/lipid kinase family protein [Gemmatimonadales bacterium]|jgi:YegS/Rv2252/BmrU family lipid kinase
MQAAPERARPSRFGRVLLIVNPAARRGDSSVHDARRAFASLDLPCDVVITERRGHGGEVAAANANDYDAIFTLGGDGTAVEVIDALAPNGPPVGILPGGTGNLLARALAIPMSVRKAVRVLVAGDEARVDLGRLADGTRFAIGAGVGIDASMIAGTTQEWKRRAGVLAYVVAGASHVLRRRRFVANITVDGASVTREAAVVLVANFGVLLNGLVTLGSGIRHDDGVLDVCIFDPVTISDVFRISRKLLFRDFTADPAMTYLQGSHISVSTDPELPAQADGELIGSTPFFATVEPLAARLLVPHCQINRQ